MFLLDMSAAMPRPPPPEPRISTFTLLIPESGRAASELVADRQAECARLNDRGGQWRVVAIPHLGHESRDTVGVADIFDVRLAGEAAAAYARMQIDGVVLRHDGSDKPWRRTGNKIDRPGPLILEISTHKAVDLRGDRKTVFSPHVGGKLGPVGQVVA